MREHGDRPRWAPYLPSDGKEAARLGDLESFKKLFSQVGAPGERLQNSHAGRAGTIPEADQR